ncbi:MAG: TlpA family protein disulfide reductase [Acidobacteria bacterium]|nr:TlpA family protein disulfide reductase [Acidobacteriota bacterium]
MRRRLLVLAGLTCLAFGWALPGALPDFTLNTLDGKAFKASEVLGKHILIIDFWATWCGPCKLSLKKFQDIQVKYPDVRVLAVSVDESSAYNAVKQYVQGKGFTFTVLLDTDSKVNKMFNPEAKIPFTLIVDKSGNIVYTHTGYTPGDEKEVIRKIEELSK